jgi:hypothetical protein
VEFEEIKDITQNILSEKNYFLTNIDTHIIKGVLEGKSYHEIAEKYGISYNYITSASNNIWKLLSEITGKKVTSNNFYPVVITVFGKQYSSKLERSIEFPAEYREAGTSILTYFSHILNIKYPDKKIKVRIEQDGLTLRMIIDTPDGEREEIEKTLDEYGLVVVGKMQPEEFVNDPFEVMALKNKLEIASLELRQSKALFDLAKDNSQQRIESLEVQVKKLHSIIEKGLQSGNNVIGVINKMAEKDRATYDLKNAKFGGGFAAEGALQVGGQFIDLSAANNLADAAKEIQELLQQLQNQGVSPEDATQQAASDLAEQAKANPGVMSKVVKWGMDTAGKTTVGEATKGVIKLTLQLLGVPLP